MDMFRAKSNNNNSPLTIDDLNAVIDRLDSSLKIHINTKIDNLRATIMAQAKEIDELKETLKGQNHRLTELENKNHQEPMDFREILREEQEKQEKKRNLIVFNIPEPVPRNNVENAGTDGRQVEHPQPISDTQALKNILSKINMVVPANEITKVKRIGKLPATGIPIRPRPLVFKLKNIGTKFDILTNSRKLRDLNEEDPLRKIVIKPDLTKAQQEADKLLVNELKARRAAGQHCKIVKGNIVTIRQI